MNKELLKIKELIIENYNESKEKYPSLCTREEILIDAFFIASEYLHNSKISYYEVFQLIKNTIDELFQ